MSDLKIYGIARTRAFRALWIAKELGLDYEHVPIEIGDAGARTAEYLAVNPNGRLPAIEAAGFVLGGSSPTPLHCPNNHSVGRLSRADLRDEAKFWQGSLGAL